MGLEASIIPGFLKEVQNSKSELDPQRKLKLEKAVRDFESLFVQQLLKSMRSSVKESGLFSENEGDGVEDSSFGSDTMSSLFDMELAKKLSQTQSLGISDILYHKITGEHLPRNHQSLSTPLKINPFIQGEIKLPEINSEFAPIKPAARPLPGDIKTLRERVEEFGDIINGAADKYKLDPNLIKAVIATESRGITNAHSQKNAKGVMQLIDSTASEMGVKDIWDPKENIFGGAKYLRTMLNRFDGDLDKALASYNAGPGAVEKHGGIPPYKETQQYVQRAKNFMNYFNLSE